jgi:hypothetical protein
VTIEPVDSSRAAYDPVQLLSALAAADVEFVVIGGIAAILHGDDAGTSATDTTVRRTKANLDRLAAALQALDARLLVVAGRDGEALVDIPIVAQALSSVTSARFLTRFGVLDVVLHPDGIPRFDDWAANATPVDIGGGVLVAVAALEDIIRSKEAAGRPKDAAALPRLHALRDLIERQGRVHP